MRVLQIANYKEGAGGISSQVFLLTKYLRGIGIQCSIYSLKGSVLRRLLSALRLYKEGKRADVFHIHACSYWGFFPAIVGISIGRLLNKKVLLTYHGGDAQAFFDEHGKIVKKYLSKTDKNIVLSGFIGSVFDNHSIDYTVLHNIIEFNPALYKVRDTIRPRFICIRSLRPVYNITCILKAFQIVKGCLADASLTLVGDGIERSNLEQYVINHSIDDVTFVGRVTNSEIPNYLDKNDILLSSPLVDNMPVSILEAFNSGLLVISSNVGGIPYMIEDTVNGLLFESNNHQELAEKMLYACFHQESSKKMIQNAFEDLCQYSWDQIKEKYLTLLH